MDRQPKTPTSLAIPLWIIAVALLLIAGAVAFQGYVELRRQKAALDETTRAETLRASVAKLPRIQITNRPVAKPVVLAPRLISAPSR